MLDGNFQSEAYRSGYKPGEEIQAMKTFVCGLILLTLVTGASAAIQWEKDFEKAHGKAGKAGKWVLTDFYMERCPACVRMEKVTFKDEKVQEVMAKFVTVRVNGPEERDVSGKYRIRAYPTFLITDASGEVLHIITGFRPEEAFIEELKPLAEGKDPRKALEERAQNLGDDPFEYVALGAEYHGRLQFGKAASIWTRALSEIEKPWNGKNSVRRLVAEAHLEDGDLEEAENWIREYEKHSKSGDQVAFVVDGTSVVREESSPDYVARMWLLLGYVSVESDPERAEAALKRATEKTDNKRILELAEKIMAHIEENREAEGEEEEE
jgi:thioredoxin-related protein